MALRILVVMRWMLALVLLGSLGCTQPQPEDEEEFHSPFLALREKKSAAPDGGTPIQPVPVDDPGNPGQPVD